MNPRTLRVPVTDPQREAFYLAEQEFHPLQRYCASLTLSQARKVIAAVRDLYALPRIGLRTESVPSRFAGWFNARWGKAGRLIGGTIVFNRDGVQHLTLPFLLHELAHAIVDVYFSDVQDHGPEFVGVMMWLYDYFQVIPQDAFAVILRRHKVRFRRFVDSAPKPVRLTSARKPA
jgi:hypothetical protein